MFETKRILAVTDLGPTGTEAARRGDAGQIGTVGRTGLTRFLLGSVAEALVGAATCSTLVVRLRRGQG